MREYKMKPGYVTAIRIPGDEHDIPQEDRDFMHSIDQDWESDGSGVIFYYPAEEIVANPGDFIVKMDGGIAVFEAHEFFKRFTRVPKDQHTDLPGNVLRYVLYVKYEDRYEIEGSFQTLWDAIKNGKRYYFGNKNVLGLKVVNLDSEVETHIPNTPGAR